MDPKTLPPTKPIILIYNGDGVAPACALTTLRSFINVPEQAYTLSVINHQHVLNTAWEDNCILFVMPGGRSTPYYAALGEDGNRRIRAFVEQGGNYLGICAGGYYGARLTEFARGLPHEIVRDGALCFFNGTAKGPAYDAHDFSYNSQQNARIVTITLDRHEHHQVYYNGGCYFIDAEKYNHTSVLARYADSKHPAIIECHYGAGKALLSGVHFEYSYHALDALEPKECGLYQKLHSLETTRQTLFNQVVQRLLTNPIH